MADQAIEFTAAQRDGRARRQMSFACDIDNRACFATADIKQQTRGALHRFELQLRVNAALVTVRSVGVQAMTACAAGDGERREEGAFQQDVAGFAVNARVLAAENTAHRQRFLMVSNHQSVSVQGRFVAIQQRQRFALFRHAHYDAAVDTVEIERVHRLAQLKQHVVSYVNHGID